MFIGGGAGQRYFAQYTRSPGVRARTSSLRVILITDSPQVDFDGFVVSGQRVFITEGFVVLRYDLNSNPALRRMIEADDTFPVGLRVFHIAGAIILRFDLHDSAFYLPARIACRNLDLQSAGFLCILRRWRRLFVT